MLCANQAFSITITTILIDSIETFPRVRKGCAGGEPSQPFFALFVSNVFGLRQPVVIYLRFFFEIPIFLFIFLFPHLYFEPWEVSFFSLVTFIPPI